ncbi:reverse transcriptase domain-containing protein [Tanacetum coccineum]
MFSEMTMENREECGRGQLSKTADNLLEPKKLTSQKISTTEADIGSPNQKNKDQLRRKTCPSSGYERKLICLQYGSATLKSQKDTRIPNYVKTYDGTRYPEDHLKIFQTAAKIKRWAMPTWCHIFNSILIGSAKVWFDKLIPESIDSYEVLRKAFLGNFTQQKKYIKDPVEIYHIKKREGESTEAFMERFKAESIHVNGAPECMRISGFMHGITNLDLIKRLNDNIPKSVDEMMSVTTTFLRGEAVVANQSRKKPGKRQERFTSLIKSLKEILAMETVKFKAPPPMSGPAENRNKGQVLHSSFSTTRDLIPRPLTSSDGQESPMVIEEEVKGHLIHRMFMEWMEGPPQRSYMSIALTDFARKSKGYTHIQMAEEDEKRLRSITRSGVLHYTKMSFGLKMLEHIPKDSVDKCLQRADLGEFWSAEEGMFLGHVINMKGIKACPEKAKAVIKLQSLRTLKDVQSLNGKLSDFQWTTEAEKAFQDMKQCITELSQLTGKNHKKGTNNVSLRGRAIERAFDINYRPRTAIRGQVLADFIAKRPDEDGAQTKVHVKEIIPDPWTLSMDGILMPRRHNDQDSTVDTPFSLPMEMDFVNNPLSRDMDMADADSLSVARTGLFFTQSTPHEYNDEDTLTNNTKFNKPQLRARRFVYCSNEASTQEDGKLSPKWGRTYEVVEHLGQRAYKDPIQGLMTYFVDLEHQRSEELLL